VHIVDALFHVEGITQMRRFFVFFLLIWQVVLTHPGFAKPRMTVQLIGMSIASSGLYQDIYLILPDGSHAAARCWTMQPACGIDPFAPEKRVKKACFVQDPHIDATCYFRESYYATRKVNDITIYAANGGRIYHITGSWDSFQESALH
jgi:hypothetical protein